LRKVNSILILILLTILVTACASKVKPLLKPADVDIQTRIANQQKRIDQGTAAKAFTSEEAQPLKENLKRIKEKYDRLKAVGEPSPKDTETIKQMLDENSDLIFKAANKGKNQKKMNR
jgi:hypothetical protein